VVVVSKKCVHFLKKNSTAQHSTAQHSTAQHRRAFALEARLYGERCNIHRENTNYTTRLGHNDGVVLPGDGEMVDETTKGVEGDARLERTAVRRTRADVVGGVAETTDGGRKTWTSYDG